VLFPDILLHQNNFIDQNMSPMRIEELNKKAEKFSPQPFSKKYRSPGVKPPTPDRSKRKYESPSYTEEKIAQI
jgi:hypothetical protein